MTRYEISFHQIGNEGEFHELLENELPLNEYYGRNLDALYDELTAQSEGWSLHFFDCEEAEKALGNYFSSFQRMCRDAEEENQYLEIVFE